MKGIGKIFEKTSQQPTFSTNQETRNKLAIAIIFRWKNIISFGIGRKWLAKSLRIFTGLLP